MLSSPIGVTTLTNNNVCSFDEGPLEVLVGLLSEPSIADLASAGFDGWNSSSIASEMSRRRKAIHAAHLTFDHDRQDVGHAGKGFEQLDVGGDFNPLLDALFEIFDLALNMIQYTQVLLHAALRFWRKGSAGFRELRPPFRGKDIAISVQGEGILGQSGMHAVLEGSALFGERHAGAVQLSLISDLVRW